MAEISLRKARTIVRKTLEKSREMGLKPMSVVVLDAGGHVKAFEREDGASPGRFDIAQGKVSELADDDRCDQEAGDHEKNIDADVAAAEGFDTEVKHHDRQHGDCP